MITRRLVLCLGLSQLICWGISYYLIGGFAEFIARDFGWSLPRVQGGFSLALLVMGLTSPITGRLVDRHGGRPVMVAGSVLLAIGCLTLAFAVGVISYYAAWVVLGLAMRLTLYDAAFAALARIGGAEARRPISQITLLGGLASTTFWPIGAALAEHFGWRGAVIAYAGFALLTIPLHLAIPSGRYEEPAESDEAAAPTRPAPQVGREKWVAASLYAVIVIVTNFLNSAMSAHMIGILSGLGLAMGVAVWISTLRGIGQSSARLCEVVFGGRFSPIDINLVAVAALPVCFAIGLASGQLVMAAFLFAFVYGAGNGIVTITRGTLPLVLFDHRTYGTFVGQLLVPSFLLSAAAPLAYAVIMERFGDQAALYLSIGMASLALIASILLRMRFGGKGT